jgi:4-hydroxy-3-methylbut-2-en-1-yl diphosphate synthase IspG/GcpE
MLLICRCHLILDTKAVHLRKSLYVDCPKCGRQYFIDSVHALCHLDHPEWSGVYPWSGDRK